MADTNVKLIHSGMAGAPTLANVAGNLVSVLNAALVDGFGLNAVDSLVIAGGVATVTRTAGHPFDVDSVALIAGATTTTSAACPILTCGTACTSVHTSVDTGLPDSADSRILSFLT